MNVQLQTSPAPDVKADALSAICFEPSKSETSEEASTALSATQQLDAGDPEWARQSGWLHEVRSSGEFKGKLYECVTLHRPEGLGATRLILVGGGPREKFSASEARRATGALVRHAKGKGVHDLALALEEATDEIVGAVVQGAIAGEWEPDKYKTDSQKLVKLLTNLTIVVPGADKARLDTVVEQARIVAEAQNATRDLVNEPPNRLAPADMVRAAEEAASTFGLGIEVLDQQAMAQLGMGALLGVAQGSSNPPFLIVLKYTPSQIRGGDHLALVGKGVTFDTGGISIKPSEGMEKMKYDMAGAAAVIGAMRAIAQLRPTAPVTGYIPTVENMLNGNAQRPGDIVTALSCKTIEVLNTDAEGRLILADALTYAKRNGATHLIDAATLTGAIGVALGHFNIGAFANDAAFFERFQEAAKIAGEKAWQLPLDEEYKEQLKSAFADMGNIGGRAGGSITAAWFLREFADPTPWIHLDIAATAWHDDAKPWMSKGPTGVAVRSFVQVALDWPQAGQ